MLLTVARSSVVRRSAPHEAALRAFVAKVRRDDTGVAGILYGSRAYDDVWAKSDIDTAVITAAEKGATKAHDLLAGDVTLHADNRRRSAYTRGNNSLAACGAPA